jgi:hypothetical protein
MKARATGLVLLILAASGAPGESTGAEITLTPRGCSSYAAWSRDLAWAKGIGADQEKARQELTGLAERASNAEERGVYQLLLNDLPALWNTTMPFEIVGYLRYQDCLLRKGRYESM